MYFYYGNNYNKKLWDATAKPIRILPSDLDNTKRNQLINMLKLLIPLYSRQVKIIVYYDQPVYLKDPIICIPAIHIPNI